MDATTRPVAPRFALDVWADEALTARDAFGAYLAGVHEQIRALLADADAASADLLTLESDLLRLTPERALAAGIMPPAAPVPDAPPVPVAPARPTPRLASLGNRPPLADCARKMSNRTTEQGAMTANVHHPALCMLLASVAETLGQVREISPASWAFDATPRPEADAQAKARWERAGLDVGKFPGFARDCWTLVRDKGERVTAGDVLAAFSPGMDALDVAMAVAPAFA